MVSLAHLAIRILHVYLPRTPLPASATISICMGKRVSLFVTCMVDQLFPKVGMAMAGVLERLGYHLDFPEDQTCCGPPAFQSGYPDEARPVAPPLLLIFHHAPYLADP